MPIKDTKTLGKLKTNQQKKEFCLNSMYCVGYTEDKTTGEITLFKDVYSTKRSKNDQNINSFIKTRFVEKPKKKYFYGAIKEFKTKKEAEEKCMSLGKECAGFLKKANGKYALFKKRLSKSGLKKLPEIEGIVSYVKVLYPGFRLRKKIEEQLEKQQSMEPFTNKEEYEQKILELASELSLEEELDEEEADERNNTLKILLYVLITLSVLLLLYYVLSNKKLVKKMRKMFK